MKTLSSKQCWFRDARLGIFIHWGPYAVPGRGEWLMVNEDIPPERYRKYAEQLVPPPEWSPEEWIALAVSAGARYAVFTARHHDGYALWNSRVNPFNSMRIGAGRDFVAEYVAACRKYGLKVGLYYSIMSWQHAAFFAGPEKDPPGWKRMVEDTHAQLRELLTGYGPIDLLWYDGCMIPGVRDREKLVRAWKTRELNEMARSLQKDLLINDRSAREEDFATPEQNLEPPRRGRLFECCMTINRHWGHYPGDEDYKPFELLLRSLLHCARFGGNLLLNIGPDAHGAIQPEVRERLRKIGDFLRENGRGIYGSERTLFTEGTHAPGPVTCRGGHYYWYVFHRREKSIRFDGMDGRGGALEVTRPLPEKPSDRPEIFEFVPGQNPGRGALQLGGRHDSVILPGSSPILGLTGDLWAPPEGELIVLSGNHAEVEVPATGKYRLELGITAERRGTFPVTVGKLHRKFRFRNAKCPDTIRLSGLELPGGTLAISLGEGLELYALRLSPEWHAVPGDRFEVAGIFPTSYRRSSPVETMGEIFRSVIPELYETREYRFSGVSGRGDHGRERLNFHYCLPHPGTGIALARLKLQSPVKQKLLAAFGCDWWAELRLNGEIVSGHRSPKDKALDGAEFNGWKPDPVLLDLQTGPNTLEIACHSGTMAHWTVLFLNRDPAEVGA